MSEKKLKYKKWEKISKKMASKKEMISKIHLLKLKILLLILF